MKKPVPPIICGREKINSIWWKYKSGHLSDKDMFKFLSVHTDLDLLSIIKILEDINHKDYGDSMSFLNIANSWYRRRQKLLAEYKEKQDEYERWLSTIPISKKPHRRNIPSHSGK